MNHLSLRHRTRLVAPSALLLTALFLGTSLASATPPASPPAWLANGEETDKETADKETADKEALDERLADGTRHQITVTSPLGARVLPVEIVNGMAVSGDIILGPANHIVLDEKGTETHTESSGVYDPAGGATYWPADASGVHVIPFYWDATIEGLPTAQKNLIKNDFLAEMVNWQNVTNNLIHFAETASSVDSRSVAIGLAQSNTGVCPSPDGGCFYKVGTGSTSLILQIPRWNFTASDIWSGNIADLLGHAIGLFHEQQRGDRDTFAFVSPILYGDIHTFDIPTLPYSGYYAAAYDIGPYDGGSVMEFSTGSWLSTGGTTLDCASPWKTMTTAPGSVFCPGGNLTHAAHPTPNDGAMAIEYYRLADHWHPSYAAFGVAEEVANFDFTSSTPPHQLIGAPAVSNRNSSQTDVFMRTEDSNLFHRAWTPSHGWYGWENLGSLPGGYYMISDPAAVSRKSGIIDIVVTGALYSGGLGQVFHMAWSDISGWSSWEPLGVAITTNASSGDKNYTAKPAIVSTNPSASPNAGDSFDVFARGNAGDMKTFRCTGLGTSGTGLLCGTQSVWFTLGGGLDSAPTAASWGPDRIDMFAISDKTSGHVWHRAMSPTACSGGWTINGRTWCDWDPIGSTTPIYNLPSFTANGTTVNPLPVANSIAPGTVSLFGRNSQNHLVSGGWNGSTWLPFTDEGGNMATDPGVQTHAHTFFYLMSSDRTFPNSSNTGLWERFYPYYP